MTGRPINPNALALVLLRKFVEMGMLEERKIGGKTAYFLTGQGRMILANFGIDENELYPPEHK
ncbi:Uncharacterised protein [uncultured archaeon]|nr:Uncharacterised protein [uncultured archaeon]